MPAPETTNFTLRATLGGLIFVGVLAVSLPAHAQTGYTMTLVSRECATYPAIMANRARNNIQESLEDLGKDSVYADGQPISPAIESANNNCVPMTVPWTFTLGRNIGGADTGSYGRLSFVGGVFRSATTTLAGVPELNAKGKPTGATIPSAVTIELTPAELQQTNNRLWVQGGVPGSPLNGLESTYGFGALRCAIDNLNGDNVEWNGYPSATTQIFCYAYYVKPPPTSGTITIVKVNNGTVPQDFTFRGNLSYTPDPGHPGDPTFNFFTLSPNAGASASATFYRGAGATWNVREDLPAGWSLLGAKCSKTGGSTITTNAPGDFSIALAAADVVTCTYTNAPQPPTAGLYVVKASGDGDPNNGLNAVGTFGLTVVGPGVNLSGTATTVTEGQAVLGISAPALAAANTYTIGETWPANDPLGTWGLDPVTPVACVTCPGGACQSVPTSGLTSTAAGASFTMVMPATPTACGFNNRLSYSAQLQVGKLALKSPGTFAFDVSRLDDPIYEFSVPVVAATPNVPTYAPPATALPWGPYRIVETSGNPGAWTLTRVQCFNQPPPMPEVPEGPPIVDVAMPAEGYVDVNLTAAQPFVRCLFTNLPATLPIAETAVPGPGTYVLAALAAMLAVLGMFAVRRRE
jgi:hypothetical protein